MVLPANTVLQAPVLVVRGSHDWRTDVERSPLSIMNKVDGIIEHFADRGEKLTKQIKASAWELAEAEAELQAVDNLEEEIENTRQELESLDTALGVKHDE